MSDEKAINKYSYPRVLSQQPYNYCKKKARKDRKGRERNANLTRKLHSAENITKFVRVSKSTKVQVLSLTERRRWFNRVSLWDSKAAVSPASRIPFRCLCSINWLCCIAVAAWLRIAAFWLKDPSNDVDVDVLCGTCRKKYTVKTQKRNPNRGSDRGKISRGKNRRWCTPETKNQKRNLNISHELGRMGGEFRMFKLKALYSFASSV